MKLAVWRCSWLLWSLIPGCCTFQRSCGFQRVVRGGVRSKAAFADLPRAVGHERQCVPRDTMQDRPLGRVTKAVQLPSLDAKTFSIDPSKVVPIPVNFLSILAIRSDRSAHCVWASAGIALRQIPSASSPKFHLRHMVSLPNTICLSMKISGYSSAFKLYKNSF